MPMPNHDSQLHEHLRRMQIIVAALVMSCVMFGIIALVFGPKGWRVQEGNEPGGFRITYLLIGVSLFNVVACAIVPNSIVKAGLQKLASQTDLRDEATVDRSLLELFQIRTITAAAAIEGATLISLLAYFIEGELISLGVAGVILVILILHLPTHSSLTEWLERQKRRLREEAISLK